MCAGDQACTINFVLLCENLQGLSPLKFLFAPTMNGYPCRRVASSDHPLASVALSCRRLVTNSYHVALHSYGSVALPLCKIRTPYPQTTLSRQINPSNMYANRSHLDYLYFSAICFRACAHFSCSFFGSSLFFTFRCARRLLFRPSRDKPAQVAIFATARFRI